MGSSHLVLVKSVDALGSDVVVSSDAQDAWGCGCSFFKPARHAKYAIFPRE